MQAWPCLARRPSVEAAPLPCSSLQVPEEALPLCLFQSGSSLSAEASNGVGPETQSSLLLIISNLFPAGSHFFLLAT